MQSPQVIAFARQSEQQRATWLSEFQSWIAAILPVLEDNSRQWTRTSTEYLQQGLTLLYAHPCARSFVDNRYRYNDFARKYLPQTRMLCERVLREIQQSGFASISSSGVDSIQQGATITTSTPALVTLADGSVNPALLSRHVGRPTKQEQQARSIDADRRRAASDRRMPPLLSTSSDGDTSSSSSTSSNSSTSPYSNGYSSPLPSPSLSSLHPTLLHLDQLKWLMSEDLSQQVDTIRTLRAAAASSAERAKALAEEGKPADVIQPYTADAHSFTEQYLAIYASVDRELAAAFVRMKEDTAYIADMRSRGVDTQEMRTILRPYFDKQPDGFRDKVIEQIKANDPQQAAERARAEEINKEALTIIKYIIRKDKPMSDTRIKSLRERYERLVSLIGEEKASKYKSYIPD